MKNSNAFSLNSTIALVTGAGGYLGSEMCHSLASHGAHVILQGRNREHLEHLQKDLLSKNLSAEIAVFDLLDEKCVEAYFTEKFGHQKLNILVNNAYSGASGTIETSSVSQFRASLEMNLTVPFLLMKHALNHMRKVPEGETRSIINIASMYGMVAPDLGLYSEEKLSNPPFYGAGKAGLIQLSRYAAVEFSKYSIRVNSVSPGPFPNNSAKANSQFVTALGQRTLLNRTGDPSELGGAIVYLASEASSFVTGSNLVVDGGWTTR